MTFTGGTWTDFNGVELTAPFFNDLTVRVGYLGDISSDGGDRTTLPDFNANPDGNFGIDDIVIFTMAWNDVNGVQDPVGDLAP